MNILMTLNLSPPLLFQGGVDGFISLDCLDTCPVICFLLSDSCKDGLLTLDDLSSFTDLELCIGDCVLGRAELYDVFISDMLLFPSLGTTVSLAVEYWDDSDAPAPEILGL